MTTRPEPLQAGHGPSACVSPPNVLVLRSARAPVVAEALAAVRRAVPGTSITALSHRGHRGAFEAMGINDIVEIDGRHFGLLRISPWELARLRRARFTHVVIPWMSDDPISHANVHLLALAIGAQSFFTYCPSSGLRLWSAGAFAQTTRRQVIPYVVRRLDAPLMLALQVIGLLWPIRRAPSRGRARVLHVVPSLDVGGAQVQIAEVLSQTPPDRYDVTLFVFARDEGNFSAHFLKRDVPIVQSKVWPHKAAVILEIMRLCRRHQIDVVHCWLCVANALGVAGARLGGVPRTIASVRSLSLWKRTWFKQWWFRWADMLTARSADVLTVNGSGLVADLARWARVPESRIRVVPNGLDPAAVVVDAGGAAAVLRSQLRVPDKSLLIGTVGRLSIEKDQALLIRAFATLETRGEQPECHLVIVGDGATRGDLEHVAATLGVASRVHFLGTRTDARQIIAGLDLFVLPSIIEGFPNALLEAVMNGTPSLATDVGGTPDILPHATDRVPVGDARALAERLGDRLADLKGAKRRARELQTRALALFTGERTTERWLELYAERS